MTGMQYDEIQMRAIRTAVEHKVMILTGGPGTGKTTTTLGIIKAFQLSNATIVLAAPTGRAAKLNQVLQDAVNPNSISHIHTLLRRS